MDILIATNNDGKVKEFERMLGAYFNKFYTYRDLGVSLNVDEDGHSFEENARKKALAAFKEARIPSLADDSGLEVNELNGAPGIFSARFSGEEATPEKNNALLLEKLKAVPYDRRRAKFKCCLALCLNKQEIIIGNGEVTGMILDSPLGENGFGYDSIFYYPPYGRSFAQLDIDEKAKVSHRSAALEDLITKISSETSLCKETRL